MVTIRPPNVILWGDIFVVVAAFETIYDVNIRFRFTGLEEQTYAGKGFVVIDAFDHPEGYNHALLCSQSTYYDMLEGIPMDAVMYGLLVRFEQWLQEVTGKNLPPSP